MVTTTTTYIVYTTGHRRRHAGTQTQLIPSATGTATAGDSFPVTAFASLPYLGNNLPFAFMSVTGAADGNHLYTTPGTQNIAVGNTNIRVLVVYAPAGGIGDGKGEGVWVDAFNVDLGDFSDADFMQVYTNGILDEAQTATANNDGVVSSAQAEDLRSLAAVDGVPFLEWQKIGGATVNNIDYDLQAHEGGFLFAFYKAPAPPYIPPIKDNYREGWIYLSPGVLVDAGGFGIRPGGGGPVPIDPLGTLPAKLLSTIALLSLATNMDKSLKNEAVNLAVSHLNAIAKSIKGMEIR
jgi:hypothetical protein